jgi:superfamily II DNA or RNA helicase
MEPSSNMRAVQSGSWQRYIKRGEWRLGQQATWDCVASRGTGEGVFARLPTGYGKTLTICGAYVIQRARGLCNRLLILVPTDALREQMAPSRVVPGQAVFGEIADQHEGIAADFRKLRLEVSGVLALSKEPRDLTYAQTGACEVFVATYQQAYGAADAGSVDDLFWRRLMSHGDWMIASDEGHHLTSDNKWGRSVQRLNATFSLYLSATPFRADGASIVGLSTATSSTGETTYVPDVEVSIDQAMREGALRRPEARVHHYFVDVKRPGDETPHRVTTESLREEGVSDFSEYEARLQLRYAPKYLSRILLDAYGAWKESELLYPGENQILVFAMTNRHAESVAGQINAMHGDLRADWIGMSRPAKENQRVLDEFKSGQLPCLVQVDKAGEGFDNVRCSILVFLHLVGSPSKLMQQIGRGLRRNRRIPRDRDRCQLFASADTPIASMIVNLDAVGAEACGTEREPVNPREPRQMSFVDIPALHVLDVTHDRVDFVAPNVKLNASHIEAGRRALLEAGATEGAIAALTPDVLANLGAARDPGVEQAPRVSPVMTETMAIELNRKKVTDATGALARNALMTSSSGSFEKSLLGDTIKVIHAQWARTTGLTAKHMTAADFERKHEWIRQINEQIKATGKVPAWLSR